MTPALAPPSSRATAGQGGGAWAQDGGGAPRAAPESGLSGPGAALPGAARPGPGAGGGRQPRRAPARPHRDPGGEGDGQHAGAGAPGAGLSALCLVPRRLPPGLRAAVPRARPPGRRRRRRRRRAAGRGPRPVPRVRPQLPGPRQPPRALQPAHRGAPVPLPALPPRLRGAGGPAAAPAPARRAARSLSEGPRGRSGGDSGTGAAGAPGAPGGRGEAVRLPVLRQAVPPLLGHARPRAGAHGRAALPLRRVRQGLHAVLRAERPRAHPHGRAPLPLRALRPHLQQLLQLPQAPAHALPRPGPGAQGRREPASGRGGPGARERVEKHAGRGAWGDGDQAGQGRPVGWSPGAGGGRRAAGGGVGWDQEAGDIQKRGDWRGTATSRAFTSPRGSPVDVQLNAGVWPARLPACWVQFVQDRACALRRASQG